MNKFTVDSDSQLTIASQIAAHFGGDGMQFVCGDERIEDVCEAHCIDKDQDWDREFTKWIFGDDSAVTVANQEWDTGYKECWCWASMGHEHGCEAA